MLGKLKFLLGYFLLWTCFFELGRVLFLLFHHNETAKLSTATIAGTLWYGLRMDLSMAAYFTAPVGVLLAAAAFVPFLRHPLTYKIYTAPVLFLVLLILIADLQVFRQWGFRMDATPLKYLSSPREAWASISHLPVFWYLLGFLLTYTILLFGLSRLFNAWKGWLRQQRYRWIQPLLLLACTAALIIPIRGGFQLAPMNQSAVYFSAENFANQAAINAPWNMMYGIVSEQLPDKNPYDYLPDAELNRIHDSLYQSGGTTTQVLHNQRPNIILVIWESFTQKATELMVEGKQVTPHFNELKKEGIYFSHAISSGDRTDKGISAVLSGYPALPQSSIIRIPNKASKLTVLNRLFKQQGYHTPFYYGGEPEFANIKSYLLHAGFDPLITVADFEKKDRNSKWGAHDGVVAARLLKDLKGQRSPFFATWLTLSSHEPFETPVAPAFKSREHNVQFLNSMHYTDQVLYDLVKACEKESWWGNTLMVVVADHGHPLPETGKKSDNFRIPILWLGGAIAEKGMQVEKIVSQLDIAATIAAQCGLPQEGFPYSRNIFDAGTSPWAFYTFNNGFGFVHPEGHVLFDNVGRRVLEKEGTLTPAILNSGKAMQQHSFADYLHK